MVAAPRLVPNFMFGVTPELLARMYAGPEQIPAIGIITDTTGSRAANKPSQTLSLLKPAATAFTTNLC